MTQRNEGEGNKTAAKEYNKGATAHARSGRSEEAARKARQAMDTPEGTEMREAEIEGKRHAKDEDPQLYRKSKSGPKQDADLN